jgi:hypothetical protein
MTSYHIPANLDKLTNEQLIEHIELAYKWLKEAEPAINYMSSFRQAIKDFK